MIYRDFYKKLLQNLIFGDKIRNVVSNNGEDKKHAKNNAITEAYDYNE